MATTQATSKDGSTIAVDTVAAADMSTNAAANGINAVNPVSGLITAVLGIWDKAVVDQSFEYVQTYGYRATSVIVSTNTSFATGVALIAVGGQVYLSSVATNTNSLYIRPHFVLAQTMSTSSANASAAILIFCQ